MRDPKEYLLKKCSFLGREFYIGKKVHIPRKNTEPLVKLASKHIIKLKKKTVCADIGTGAGVVAITLMLENPSIKKIFATDIHLASISTAKKNIEKYKLENKIILKKGSLLTPLKNKKIDIITANLPHASEEAYKKKKYLLFEHKKSTLAGKTGLEFLEVFLKELSKYKFVNSVSGIFLKISPKKKKESITLVKKYLPNYRITLKKDSEGKFRYVCLKNR